MRVIAFETSCDETSVAVVESGFKVLSNVTKTHLEHRDYGGVVPELASRAHMRLIYPLTEEALKRSGLTLNEIDGVAATYGPGLIGALLVGLTFAKTLAQMEKKPFIGINHLEGHIFSVYLTEKEIPLPLLALIVSGGHTELIWMEEPLKYKILGETLDDAAGEAFDKVAKMLGLPYPGGPEIDRLSERGNREAIHFPRAQVKDLDFSFSGLKTAVLYYLRDHGEPSEEEKGDIAASFQEAVCDMLLEKTDRALDETKPRSLAVVGGVAMNRRLREKFRDAFEKRVYLFFPKKEYTVDNAAMIGAAAILRLECGESSPLSLPAVPDLRLV
jgi:N6-L-threonylcarbamoyladenine synthase